jgi:hypothetical protein
MEPLVHTTVNTTAVLISLLFKVHQLDRSLLRTESVVNIDVLVTWPVVQHTQHSQVAAAQDMQLTHRMPVGAALALAALLK